MDKKTLTREELYDLVWTEPARALAPKLGLSDVGLSKLCRRHQVPKPGVGHWEKVRHGKRVRRPRLPELPAGGAASVLLPATPSAREESASVATQRAFEARPENRIVVRPTLRRAHPLVLATRNALKGRFPARGSTWGDPRASAHGDGLLGLHVSKGTLDRALRIYDALLKGAEARGFQMSPTRRQGHRRGPPFQVGGEAIHVRIEEPCRAEERPGKYDWRPVEKVLVPSGRLVLRIDAYADGPRKSWSDGKHQRVEDGVNDFFISLVAVGEILAERTRENNAWRERQQREREARELEARRQAAEAALVKELRGQAAALAEARAIRDLVAVAQGTGKGPAGQVGEDLVRWTEWASGCADRLDPLTPSEVPE